MPLIDPVKLRNGMKIVVDGTLYVVTDVQHRTPGNLRSFVQTKLRSYADKRVVDKTFRGAADFPEVAEFEQKSCQFLYADQEGYHFMDLKTYDQFQLEGEFLGLQTNFLIPEAEVIVSFWNNKPIGVELPPKMVFKIVDTIEAVSRGNSSGNITKDATLETGLVIQVPNFVKNGDKVLVSTEDGHYVERA